MSPLAERDWVTTGRGRLVRGALAAVATVLGALQTWMHRHAIWPDVVSYLDVGDACLRADWPGALSGHWSPLYPCTVGLALVATRPGPEHELAVLKGVDLLLFVFAMGTFDLLLKEVVRSARGSLPGSPLPPWIVIVAGHTVFLWASLKWLVVYRDNPDGLVAALVYLAAALLLRARRLGRTQDFGRLGVVLGLAYLAKTVMFPLGFFFLVAAALPYAGPRPSGRQLRATLLPFLAVSGLFIAALSWRQGQFTIGEAGRLNYAWLINPGVPDTHWQGHPPGSGRPRHPTRKVFEAPAVYEYATPIGGTYPPWFDPAYWNEGLTPGFDLRQQARLTARNLVFCGRLFGGTLLLGLLFAYVLGARPTPPSLLTGAPLLLPGLAGVATHVVGTILPVHKLPWGDLQARYMGSFIVLLFVGLLGSLRVASGRRARWRAGVAMLACALFAETLVVGLARGVAVGQDLPTPQWQVAGGLQRLGIRAGEPIGLVGVDPSFHWWARLARVKIVAEVESRGFWKGDDETRRQVLMIMRRAGVRALVSPPPLPGSKRPKGLTDLGWRALGPSDYYALVLSP